MLLLGIIFVVVGLLLLVMSILLCCGFTNLLHSYHRNNVDPKDNKKFGLSTGLSLMIAAFGTIADGLLAIFIKDESMLWLCPVVFCACFMVSMILTIIFIRKYNGSLFG